MDNKRITLRTRFRTAWRALTGSKVAYSMVPTWAQGQPVYPEVNYWSLANEGYRRNELIFSCINKTARASSYVGLELVDDNEEIIDKSPVLDFMANPMGELDLADFFYSVVTFQKIGGRAFYEKVLGPRRELLALKPIRPDTVYPILGRAGIDYFEIREGDPPYPKLLPEEVVNFKLWDPLNIYNGWPPLAVLIRSTDVDNAITDFYKILMQKGGVPPGYIKVKTTLRDATATESYRETWESHYGGYLNWTSPAILDNEADYMKTGFSIAELGMDTMDSRDEARICMVLDVPPIIVGAKVGLDRSTFANYQEARASWWEDSLLPMFNDFLNVINSSILPHFMLPGEAKLQLDTSQVPALKDDEDKRWTRITTALGAGYITVNEARQEVGLEDIGPTGEIFLRSMNLVEVPKDMLQSDLTGDVPDQLQPFSGQDQEDEAPGDNPADTEDQEDISGEMSLDPTSNGHKRAGAGTAPDEKERRKIEREVERSGAKYFKQQLQDIMEVLEEEYPGRR